MDQYPYPRYTILLDTTRALAHIGVHIYTPRFRLIKFLAPLLGISLVCQCDIDNKAIRYYSGIFFLFFFTSAGNLVFLFRV